MFLTLKVHIFAIYKKADAVDSPPYNFEFVPQDTTNFSVMQNHADPPRTTLPF